MFEALMRHPQLSMAFFAVLGLIFGSFANVVILRLPRGESIAVPGSHCPQCKKPIRWYDNIPVLSWLLLRARCRYCNTRIHWRYPLVELLMALAFVGVFASTGWNFLLPEYLWFAFGLVVVSFIDFDHMILPDVFTLSGIVIGLAGAWLNPERTFCNSMIGVLVGGGLLWATAYVYFTWRKVEGMGGGDIKLLAWIGAVTGLEGVLYSVFVGCLTGSVVGLIIATRAKDGFKTAIPFGPYLALGGMLFVTNALGGQELARWYRDLFLLPFCPVN